MYVTYLLVHISVLGDIQSFHYGRSLRSCLGRRRQRPSAGARATAATEADGRAPPARLRGPPRVTAYSSNHLHPLNV